MPSAGWTTFGEEDKVTWGHVQWKCEQAVQLDSLETRKRSRLQVESGGRRHTGTLSVPTADEEGVWIWEEEAQRRHLQHLSIHGG